MTELLTEIVDVHSAKTYQASLHGTFRIGGDAQRMHAGTIRSFPWANAWDLKTFSDLKAPPMWQGRSSCVKTVLIFGRKNDARLPIHIKRSCCFWKRLCVLVKLFGFVQQHINIHDLPREGFPHVEINQDQSCHVPNVFEAVEFRLRHTTNVAFSQEILQHVSCLTSCMCDTTWFLKITPVPNTAIKNHSWWKSLRKELGVRWVQPLRLAKRWCSPYFLWFRDVGCPLCCKLGSPEFIKSHHYRSTRDKLIRTILAWTFSSTMTAQQKRLVIHLIKVQIMWRCSTRCCTQEVAAKCSNAFRQ